MEIFNAGERLAQLCGEGEKLDTAGRRVAKTVAPRDLDTMSYCRNMAIKATCW